MRTEALTTLASKRAEACRSAARRDSQWNACRKCTTLRFQGCLLAVHLNGIVTIHRVSRAVNAMLQQILNDF